MICRTREPLRDTQCREIRDLRISVTDRCNFRCPYCMPPELDTAAGAPAGLVPRSHLLEFEEIHRLARLFIELGIRKIRLTGGEPLLRRHLTRLIRQLARLDSLDDLALTTNGQLLARHAGELEAAGLRRVTVSLDTLDPEQFRRMSGGRGELDDVVAGIEAARRSGLAPIKLNTVVIRGQNDDQIVPVARFARERGLTARFIEYMDVGNANCWRPADVVTVGEIIERLEAAGLEVVPVNDSGGRAVAERYLYADGAGEVGIIASITRPFCSSCTRVRLSARGRLYTCLFATEGFDARALLRNGAADREILACLEQIWRGRTDRYSEERADRMAAGNANGRDQRVEMFEMGG